MIHSWFLHIPVNDFFFFFWHFHNVRVIVFVSLCPICFSFRLQPAILSFHLLGIENAAAGHVCGGGGVVVCFPRSVDCSNTLGVELPYDIICVILWFQGTLTVMLINLWPLTSHQWHTGVLFTNFVLLFLVCRVLDNGLFGFSLEILPCTLTFRFTENRANEAHFQRLLSKHWLSIYLLMFPSWSWDLRLFFFFFLVCHPWPFSKGSFH